MSHGGSGGGPPQHSYWNVNEQQQQQYQHQSQQHSDQQHFTAEMRDWQARGQDPYNPHDPPHDPAGSSDAAAADRARYCGGSSSRDETFTTAEARRRAAQVLDSPELLMTLSEQQGDSIPATRLKYTRMLTGLDEKKKAQGPTHGSSSGTPGRRRSGRQSSSR